MLEDGEAVLKVGEEDAVIRVKIRGSPRPRVRWTRIKAEVEEQVAPQENDELEYQEEDGTG